MPLFGAHVSIAGGLEKAVERGEALGCEAIQIFSRNQRQWRSSPITEAAAEAFLQSMEKSSIQQVIVHDSYLINLAQPDREKRERSLAAFAEEMQRAGLLQASALVFHPGAHMGSGADAGIETVAAGLNRLLDRDPDGRTILAIEVTAGQGTNLGCTFEQIAGIIDRIGNKARMGICFDTAHAFAAGYDISKRKGYRETFSDFERILGMERLTLFHLNDSKTPAASRVDRHDNLGAGMI